MIVPTSRLSALAGTTAMVDGGFDPLHPGHVAYFREAATLGAPVLCNVSSDEWVRRKHVPFLTQEERGAIIEAIRYVTYVHLSRTATADVIRVLRPRYYVKGSDWRLTLPEAEQRVCADAGVEIVFLDTVISSSSAILERYGAKRAD